MGVHLSISDDWIADYLEHYAFDIF